ncbi:MAG: hypothetical protein QNJ72_42870, partial [Pleurocapsa sp. MO_226.B13]|nr:hypothetical protein [Pleurocapsa sp. MO_226.B13]
IFLSNSEIASIALESDSAGNDNSGIINLQSNSLILSDRAQISVSTDSQGDAGDIFIEAKDFVSLDRGSVISSAVQEDISATGNGGNIEIKTRSLSLTNGGQVNASVLGDVERTRGGQGNGGNIIVNASESITLSGFNPLEIENFSRNSSALPGASSGFYTLTEVGSRGSGGSIEVNTEALTITDGAVITAQTFNNQNGGNITINANSLEIINGGQVLSNTSSGGNAGQISLDLTGDLLISESDPNFSDRLTQFEPEAIVNAGATSGLFANTDINSTGKGGEIVLTGGNNLILRDTAAISAQSEGTGNAGNINLILQNEVEILDSNIITAADNAAGGEINLSGKNISLAEDADISTNVLSGSGGGGDIILTADSIIAFDDSDIFAFAADGRGGNITLDTPAFFAENFTLNSLEANPEILENNSRADLNATGAVSGAVSIPDVSFIQNSLTELPDNSINTDELVANSCVAPVGNRRQGRFIITGGDSLPLRPGNADLSDFSTGEVRSVPNNNRGWQPGDPIIEPQGMYRLTNGKLVLSRECPNSK